MWAEPYRLRPCQTSAFNSPGDAGPGRCESGRSRSGWPVVTNELKQESFRGEDGVRRSRVVPEGVESGLKSAGASAL